MNTLIVTKSRELIASFSNAKHALASIRSIAFAVKESVFLYSLNTEPIVTGADLPKGCCFSTIDIVDDGELITVDCVKCSP